MNELVNMNINQLVSSLALTLKEIEAVLEDIAQTEAARHKAYVEGFMNSMAKTVSEREKEAERHGLIYSTELTSLRAAREILLLRKNFIELLIDLHKHPDKPLNKAKELL